jgi:phosphatidylserine/phosphatidylglycerophosphate/cardiolipin synthase-like enzyme
MALIPPVLSSPRDSLELVVPFIARVGPKLQELLGGIAKARRNNPRLKIRLILGRFNARTMLERLPSSTGEWIRSEDARVLNPRSGLFCTNKLIVVDRRVCMVGSTNWSEAGLSQSRYVSLLIDSQAISEYYLRIFEADWKAGLLTTNVRSDAE